jgi:hypothetical protein
MKYYLYVVEDCSPSIREFSTDEERSEFLVDFLLKSQDNPDNFIDIIFEGTVSYLDASYRK